MDYMALFPGYTRSMPRFAALSEAVLRQATDLMALVPEVESGFSVAGAAGAQLDALGASFLTPRQLGWDDETYREVLRRKLKRAAWNGMNGTVSAFLEAGDRIADHDDWTAEGHTGKALSVPACDVLPVVMGEKVVSDQ